MPDRRTDPSRPDPHPESSGASSGAGASKTESPESQALEGGYEGGGPEYGRGYGRDFGGGGLNQGFDGSWGRGYGGSTAPADYRRGGPAPMGHDAGFGGRDEALGLDDRSWIDQCADDEASGRKHHRGRGPKGWARDDQRLYEEVCERLLHDRLIDARGIEVEVDDGVVTLRGEARAAADPMLAERLVRETPGVKDVRLDLQLRPRPPEPQPQPSEDERIDKSPMGYPILPT